MAEIYETQIFFMKLAIRDNFEKDIVHLQLDRYNRILKDKNIEINATKMFNVDYKLIFNIYGGLMTYGLVIYQTNW